MVALGTDIDVKNPDMTTLRSDNALSRALSSLNPFATAWRSRSGRTVHSADSFHAHLARERARTDRTGQEFSLVRFDTASANGNGHEVLQRLSEGLAGRIRETDEIGRYDDTSVAVLLPGTGSAGAWTFAKGARTENLAPQDSVTCTVFTYPSCWIGTKGNGDGKRQSEAPAEPNDAPAEDLKPVVARRMPIGKRMLDILGALAGLIVLSPLFLFLALLIKIVSPGPVFFRQERVGHGGRPFTFLKFRTMHVNNDAGVHQRYLSSLIQGDQAMEKLDADRDPRIIRFGRFLRQSCLDELPQLINVLKGEMSLVGPRPCLPYEAKEYLLWHARRFDTVPGMTGLWQVSGKNKTTFKEMIRFDINYAKTMSPWLDLKILLKTGPAIFKMVAEHLSKKCNSSPETAHAAAKRA